MWHRLLKTGERQPPRSCFKPYNFKIKKLKRKLNHFDKLKAGIELNDSSEIDLLEQDNITFKCKTLDGYAPMLTIEEIIETKKK